MKKTLEKAAKKGRYGDNRLLHVSETELEGLASLIPGGKLPTNPDTGLPEAFFFLPFLAGLAGAAAPAAAATTAAGLGAAGLTAGLSAAAPAAAGLGAAGLAALPAATAATALPAAATAALPAATGATAAGLTGLQAAGLTSGLTTGLTAASPALPAAAGGTMLASAAPEAVGLGLNAAAPIAAANPLTASSLLGSGAAGSGAASGLGSLSTLGGVPMAAAPTSAAALPSATTALGAANPVAAATGTGTVGSGVVPGAGTAATAADAAAAAGVGGLTPAASTAGAAKTGLAGLFGGMDTGKLLQYGALGAMMLPRGGGGGETKKEKVKSQEEIGGKQYSLGEQAAAPEGGNQGGTTPEWKYFPNAKYYAEGGLVYKEDPHYEGIESAGSKDGFHNSRIHGTAFSIRQGMDEGTTKRKLDQMKNAMKSNNYAEGGMVEGGGGIASLMEKGSQPVSEDDSQLIDATVAAIQGQTPNAQGIIQQFVQTFGQEALQHLVQEITAQQGQSDGMNDAIPAQINGGGIAGLSAPAQLSEGEYVIPSDVVSHLGNGSTQAGERQLSEMVDRTRKARGAKAPEQIDPNQVMPA